MKLKRKLKNLVKFCIKIWYTEWTDNEWKKCFKICFITNIIICLLSVFFSFSDYLVSDSDITYISEAISGVYSGETLENTIYPLYDKYEENFSVEILSKNEIDVEYNSTIIHYTYTGSELKMNIDKINKVCLIITIVLIYLFIILVWCVIWVYICIIFSWLWRNKISGYINKFIRNIKKDDNENERQDNIDDEKSSEPKVIDIKDLYDNKK